MLARRRLWWFAPLLAFCLGCILIPLAGLESDESVFGLATFGGLDRQFCVTIFGHRFPLMIFYYAGSLKGILYWPVLHVLGPNLWSIRLPAVLSGAACVALLYDFTRIVSDRKIAVIAAFLLAADPCFIISNAYDWGPVALEHLLLLAGLALLARGRHPLACFLFGLALWNKAVFAWALAGLIVGGAAAYWPAFKKTLTLRCALAFIAGCAPLLLYNIRHPGSTARSNVHLSFEGLHDKLTSLRYTLDGSDLFGVVASMDGVTDSTGLRFHDLFLIALVVSIAVTLWRIRSPGYRPARFALAFCLTSFLLIALTRYAGAAHHIVLLYPMPHLLIAVVVGSMGWKRVSDFAAAALVSTSLLVFSTYVWQLRRAGAAELFTDAIGALSQSFANGGDHVYPIDYGLWENVWLLHGGKLRMQFLQPPADMKPSLDDPRAVFADHTAGHEYYDGAEALLDREAAQKGLRRVPVRTIADSKGKARIEVFRYVR